MKVSWQDIILGDLDRYYRLAFCYVKNKQDAGDIVQESLYKALRNSKGLKDSGAVRTWFYRIVVNTSLDFIKKEKKLVYLDEQQWEAIPDEDRENDLDLRAAVDALTPPYKTVIALRYFEGMKISEIADILQENENTIKTRIYSALKKLRVRLEEDEPYV